jgi:predicted GIY-YIG superfamily endonuclease
MLRPIKDKLGLKVTGIYCVLCECGKVYVGQTGKTIETRCKKHMRYICLDQPEKSVVVEHRF